MPNSIPVSSRKSRLRRLAFEALVAESLAESALNGLLATLNPAQLSALAALLDARDRQERALRELAGEMLGAGVSWDDMLRAIFYSFETIEALATLGHTPILDRPSAPPVASPLQNLAALAGSVFEHTDIAMVIYGADGTLIGMNEANRKMAGVPSREFGVGKFNVLTDRLTRANGMSAVLAPAFRGEVVHNPRIRVDWDLPENRHGLPRRSSYYDDLALPVREADGQVVGVARFTRELAA